MVSASRDNLHCSLDELLSFHLGVIHKTLWGRFSVGGNMAPIIGRNRVQLKDMLNEMSKAGNRNYINAAYKRGLWCITFRNIQRGIAQFARPIGQRHHPSDMPQRAI